MYFSSAGQLSPAIARDGMRLGEMAGNT